MESGGMAGSCRESILRNHNVACIYHLFMLMSHAEFKKGPCRMSLNFSIPCHMFLELKSPAILRKSRLALLNL